MAAPCYMRFRIAIGGKRKVNSFWPIKDFMLENFIFISLFFSRMESDGLDLLKKFICVSMIELCPVPSRGSEGG